MGIKDIKETLKSIGFVIDECDIREYQNTIIAIDAMIVFYNCCSGALKHTIDNMTNILNDIDREVLSNKLIHDLLVFNKRFVDMNITPVWVFDGTNSPLKKNCQDLRKVKRETLQNKIKDEKTRLENIDEFDITKEDTNSYSKLIKSQITFSNSDIITFREILTKLGIKSISALDEGEKLCCELQIEGLVDAVWSKDTDTIAFGATNIIFGFADKGTYKVERLKLGEQRELINIPQKSITDMCIMLGTDFNSNIPGIGKVTVKKLIQQYGNIDDIPDSELNKKASKKAFQEVANVKDILNHHVCRNIFSCSPTYLSQDDIIMDFLQYSENNREIYKKYNLKGY